MSGPSLERPLIVRCGAFGDMVLLTALIRPLSARFGRPVDILTSGPWSVPLLRGQPGVGDILQLRSRKTPYWLSIEQQRIVRLLKERAAGPVWYCDGNDAALHLLERARIPDDWIVSVKDHGLRHGEHATEQWRRLAQILPARLSESDIPLAPLADIAAGCALEVPGAERRDLKDFLVRRGVGDAPLILIQIGNKRTMRRGLKRLAANSKYWPNERWAQVLRHLRANHPDHALVLLGTGPEFALNEELRALANIRGLYNVADDLPIPRLLALLDRARGLVTVDSGPAHAAAAVGCPQVVLFGKALPSLYRPWGAADADVKVLQGQVAGQPDMLGITPQAVISAWAALAMRPLRAAYPG
jgi:heptosyltransferase-2/heptosyltransferase-3